MFYDNEFDPHNESQVQNGTAILHLKRSFLNWIEHFIERGHNFSLVYEKNSTIVSIRRYMSFEFYIK